MKRSLLTLFFCVYPALLYAQTSIRIQVVDEATQRGIAGADGLVFYADRDRSPSFREVVPFTTDSQGIAKMTLNQVGTFEIYAYAHDYQPDCSAASPLATIEVRGGRADATVSLRPDKSPRGLIDVTVTGGAPDQLLFTAVRPQASSGTTGSIVACGFGMTDDAGKARVLVANVPPARPETYVVSVNGGSDRSAPIATTSIEEEIGDNDRVAAVIEIPEGGAQGPSPDNPSQQMGQMSCGPGSSPGVPCTGLPPQGRPAMERIGIELGQVLDLGDLTRGSGSCRAFSNRTDPTLWLPVGGNRRANQHQEMSYPEFQFAPGALTWAMRACNPRASPPDPRCFIDYPPSSSLRTVQWTEEREERVTDTSQYESFFTCDFESGVCGFYLSPIYVNGLGNPVTYARHVTYEVQGQPSGFILLNFFSPRGSDSDPPPPPMSAHIAFDILPDTSRISFYYEGGGDRFDLQVRVDGEVVSRLYSTNYRSVPYSIDLSPSDRSRHVEIGFFGTTYHLGEYMNYAWTAALDRIELYRHPIVTRTVEVEHGPITYETAIENVDGGTGFVSVWDLPLLIDRDGRPRVILKANRGNYLRIDGIARGPEPLNQLWKMIRELGTGHLPMTRDRATGRFRETLTPGELSLFTVEVGESFPSPDRGPDATDFLMYPLNVAIDRRAPWITAAQLRTLTDPVIGDFLLTWVGAEGIFTVQDDLALKGIVLKDASRRELFATDLHVQAYRLGNVANPLSSRFFVKPRTLRSAPLYPPFSLFVRDLVEGRGEGLIIDTKNFSWIFDEGTRRIECASYALHRGESTDCYWPRSSDTLNSFPYPNSINVEYSAWKMEEGRATRCDDCIESHDVLPERWGGRYHYAYATFTPQTCGDYDVEAFLKTEDGRYLLKRSPNVARFHVPCVTTPNPVAVGIDGAKALICPPIPSCASDRSPFERVRIFSSPTPEWDPAGLVHEMRWSEFEKDCYLDREAENNAPQYYFIQGVLPDGGEADVSEPDTAYVGDYISNFRFDHNPTQNGGMQFWISASTETESVQRGPTLWKVGEPRAQLAVRLFPQGPVAAGDYCFRRGHPAAGDRPASLDPECAPDPDEIFDHGLLMTTDDSGVAWGSLSFAAGQYQGEDIFAGLYLLVGDIAAEWDRLHPRHLQKALENITAPYSPVPMTEFEEYGVALGYVMYHPALDTAVEVPLVPDSVTRAFHKFYDDSSDSYGFYGLLSSRAWLRWAEAHADLFFPRATEERDPLVPEEIRLMDNGESYQLSAALATRDIIALADYGHQPGVNLFGVGTSLYFDWLPAMDHVAFRINVGHFVENFEGSIPQTEDPTAAYAKLLADIMTAYFFDITGRPPDWQLIQRFSWGLFYQLESLHPTVIETFYGQRGRCTYNYAPTTAPWPRALGADAEKIFVYLQDIEDQIQRLEGETLVKPHERENLVHIHGVLEELAGGSRIFCRDLNGEEHGYYERETDSITIDSIFCNDYHSGAPALLVHEGSHALHVRHFPRPPGRAIVDIDEWRSMTELERERFYDRLRLAWGRDRMFDQFRAFLNERVFMNRRCGGESREEQEIALFEEDVLQRSAGERMFYRESMICFSDCTDSREVGFVGRDGAGHRWSPVGKSSPYQD